MEREDMYSFLIRAAIPRVDKHYLPEGLDESNWIWDAVFRAHRDVLTGRGNVTAYSNPKNVKEFTVGRMNRKVNTIALSLYNLIEEKRANGVMLTSEQLISEMKDSEQGSVIAFGQLQKLVNMTLKYLVILQSFGKIEPVVDVNECDCPIDSIIIKKLGLGEKYRWTSLKESEYKELQERVAKEIKTDSRLKYDFKVWQEPNEQ